MGLVNLTMPTTALPIAIPLVEAAVGELEVQTHERVQLVGLLAYLVLVLPLGIGFVVWLFG